MFTSVGVPVFLACNKMTECSKSQAVMLQINSHCCNEIRRHEGKNRAPLREERWGQSSHGLVEGIHEGKEQSTTWGGTSRTELTLGGRLGQGYVLGEESLSRKWKMNWICLNMSRDSNPVKSIAQSSAQDHPEQRHERVTTEWWGWCLRAARVKAKAPKKV